jgi:ADP-ribosylation factor GTPase-activating protein 2/3
MAGGPTDGSSTPAGEPDDDFFSSWDKPTIKRPTPPVSRTATPPVIGRTPSPFLSAGTNGNGIARTPSPLINVEGAGTPPPAASRTTTSAALRKGTTTGAGPRKANVLGAKKTQKLGAKKITGEVIDFDAAERKAKEEAERIEKLGYDPEAEEAADKKITITTKTADTKIIAPSPVSPGRGEFGSTQGREHTNSELERLGMGIGRLGFGQIGGNKPAAAAPKKAGGFGSVGPIKATEEGKWAFSAPLHPLRPHQI